MFRSPQILSWSCPLRPLLLSREPHFAAFSEHPGVGWQVSKALKERRYVGIHGSKKGSSLPTQTVFSSTQLSLFNVDCDKQQPNVASFQNLLSKVILPGHHHPPHVPASVSHSWKCRVAENLCQNFKAVSTHKDCLINTTCLQPWRRPQDIKTLCNAQRENFVRPSSLSTGMPWIFNHFDGRAQPSSFSFHQTRAVHQAAPHLADPRRDCLSLENENRCRQSLRANLKLYEMGKGRNETSKSQGKNQAKWASVLVCLCSVEGEPAILFTLRSSTLKGRHKGDVR